MSEFTPIQNETELNEVLTRPRLALVEFMRTVQSPLVILGAGGKMGPSLAVLARRAAEQAGQPLDILAVSRFADDERWRWLEQQGVRTLSLDLSQRSALEQLPDTISVLYLVGLKFGTTQNPELTWATNTLLPAYVCERYPQARIVALSSGNVYSLTAAHGPGSQEGDPLEPLGEYSNSCVARERIFEYFSLKNQTPIVLLRLSYAIDLRYGVLNDIARRVYEGEAIDLRTGYFNCIWQGDANELILRALALAQSPALALNLTGTVRYSVREIAEQFGRVFDKEPNFQGRENDLALLSDTRRMVGIFGAPATPPEWMVRWTADWVKAGRRTLNKPTHYEAQDGKY